MINRASTPATVLHRVPTGDGDRTGLLLLAIVAGAFIAATAPVVIRGAPLADDYFGCIAVERTGLRQHLANTLAYTGLVRPARFLEIALIGTTCRRIPFSVLIVIPLALTLGVAGLLRGLLRDLHSPSPWPEVGAAAWLLQPLGTEAALWPSALHIPLGLCLALVALRLHRRAPGSPALAFAVGAAACLAVEQLIFALPVAVWLVSSPSRRLRRSLIAAGISVAILIVYARWPGSAPRAPLHAADMLRNVVSEPFFYVRYPATSLGLHSIPLALRWALPWSVVLLALGSILGAIAGPRLLGTSRSGGDSRLAWTLVGAMLLLVVLMHVPVVVTVPHPNEPRVFTPAWLALSALVAVAGYQVRWRRLRSAGALAGGVATAAMLSVAFSVSVRVRTADFAESSLRWLGARVPSGGVVAVCDVPRTAVPYAPTGAFAVHEYLHDWVAEPALQYYTRVRARFRLGGRYWSSRCPDADGADIVVTFGELQRVSRASQSGR